MRPESLYFLFSPITRIKGVGSVTAKALERLLPPSMLIAGSSVPIVRDLLFHLPVGIVDRRNTFPLNHIPKEPVVATFIVTVDEHIPPPQKRRSKSPYKVLCSNETGDITLVFFHAHTDYIKQSLPVGSKRVISGRVESFDYRLQMPHPDIIAPVEKLAEVQQPEPVYPLTVGITSRRIAGIVNDALVKLPELPEWLEKLPPPLRGRVGVGGATEMEPDYGRRYSPKVLSNAKILRTNPTDAESKLWQLLRRKQLEQYKFRRQQPIGNYIVDFFCAELGLIIELDGGQHADQQIYDDKRTQFLETQGYRVLRFWNNDIFQNIEGVYQIIEEAIKSPPPPNPLPQGEGELSVTSWKTALHTTHHPQSEEDLLPESPARMRLAYDEILANQLHLGILRRHMQQQAGEVIKGTQALTEALIKSLPFALTGGQKQALAEIYGDMESGRRMGRLLQGDVGSGKTVVALLAMLRAAEQGLQTALMVPTEIIAQQHFQNISSLLATCHLPLTTVLLTGSVKGKHRQETLGHIASGNAQIVIGTHALFQEHVAFKNLALVVIDEQHRFGVGQRMALSAKGNQPHLLHMTATPIPRSLTMTLYGDMDCSQLKEKPAGRQHITTRVIPLSRYREIIERLKAALDKGEKVYWICPLIEDLNENADDDLAAAKSRFTEFTTRFGPIVGLVHGRMKTDVRNAEMQKFSEGQTRLLVATTVVEVGVDVRDATIMVVEKAERFGLSQLHQLRGRVGRGDKPSSCVLLYDERVQHSVSSIQEKNNLTSLNAESQMLNASLQRLSILRETEDGFRIAEEDLRIRGGGDLLGVRQSGLPRFIFTDLFLHQELLQQARDDVRQFLDADPMLSSSRGQALKLLLQLFGFDAADDQVSSPSSASSGTSSISTTGTA